MHLVIQNDLTWSKHIESVFCKPLRLLGYIYCTFSSHCSPESLLLLYKTQVLPILEYGRAIWYPHFKKDTILLEKVQYCSCHVLLLFFILRSFIQVSAIGLYIELLQLLV